MENLPLFDETDIHEQKYFKTSMLNFSDEVRGLCAKNYCGKYKSNWQCPPGCGEVADLKIEFLKYQDAFIFSTLSSLEDSYDFEGMVEAEHKHKRITYEVFEKFKAIVCKQSKVLKAGACDLCAKCTYPDNPCRFPDIAVPSIEAVGVNVVEITRDLGIHYINGVNTVTYFSVIFFNKVEN